MHAWCAGMRAGVGEAVRRGLAVMHRVVGNARPGLMVSGRVTFPDGQGGGWYVDEMGRLGIDPDTAGYRPSEPDLVAFQQELQTVMDRG